MKTSQVMHSSVVLKDPDQRFALNGDRQPAIKRMQCRGFGLEKEQLVEQCLGGNQEAWAELVSSYRGLVYSIAASIAKCPVPAVVADYGYFASGLSLEKETVL